MTPPTVGVVVPTRDRPDALTACLAAIDRQRRAPDVLVVVDDGSVDPTTVAAVVASARTPTRLVRAEGGGPAAARNRGAEAAGTEVVCFTDDDCRPQPGWIEALLAPLTTGSAAAAGPTVTGPDASASVRAAQTVTNHVVRAALGTTGRTVAFAPTSNLAVLRPWFEQHPFDEGFPLAAGEDRAWCDDLRRAGGSIAYVPEAIVDHHPALDLRGFWRQQVRYGRGAHRYRQRPPLGPRPGVGWYAALLREGLRQGPAVGALVAAAQVATAVGYGREATGR